jgi:hypothetical protein
VIIATLVIDIRRLFVRLGREWQGDIKAYLVD